MVAIRQESLTIEELESGLPGRLTRRDALPEHTHYADTGCDLFASCLSCPLERCRYEEPAGGRYAASRLRDLSILELQREGVPANAIAHRVGISRRTVFRVLARSRSPV